MQRRSLNHDRATLPSSPSRRSGPGGPARAFWAGLVVITITALAGFPPLIANASTPLSASPVGITASVDGGGWIANANGSVQPYGGAPNLEPSSPRLNSPIVGIERTPTGLGYWLVAADGGIFSFGDAAFYGSTGNIHINKPIVGMATTPDGQGYWLVASDGGIFSFGDAVFAGAATSGTNAAYGITSAADGSYTVGTISGPLQFLTPGAQEPSVVSPDQGATSVNTSPLSTQDQSTSPSGQTIPATPPPGMHQVFADNFIGTSLDSQWFAYVGQPGGDPGDYFDKSQVSVSGGLLHLYATKNPASPNGWLSGGVSNRWSTGALTYGGYFLRMKATAAEGIADVAMIWPVQNIEPGEIDFAEDGGGSKMLNTGTLHYTDADGQPDAIQSTVAVNMTQWHTYGVIVEPGIITYYLDGIPWAVQLSSHVPTLAGSFAIQTQAWSCGTNPTYETCPDTSTPPSSQLEVDWAVAYSLNSQNG